MFLWITAEISIVACDIQAVICSAIAINILLGWPLWVGCIVTSIDALTFLMIDVFGIHKLESFFVLLVSIMAICFFWNFGVNSPIAAQVFSGLVPLLPTYALKPAVGLIGSIILPQNFYLHR
jgi:NRAMP (natural resistance-associated macrophage protein)-like metal ion transporter